MNELSFKVEGQPVPWSRAGHNRKTNHFFTPPKMRDYMSLIAWTAISAGAKQRSGPVSLSLHFCLKIPKSWSLEKKNRALSGEIHHINKPDASNLVKIFEDALNKIAYIDDSQIDCLNVKKSYGEPCVYVTITYT